jgi:hypothetical protein
MKGESEEARAARDREEQRRMEIEQRELTADLIRQSLDSHGGPKLSDRRGRPPGSGKKK